MSAATAAKAGGPVKCLSPKKETTQPPPPTKTGPSSTIATDATAANGGSGFTSVNATAKGSRRAQGWHSAVGTGGPGGGGDASTASGNTGIRETHSNLEGKGLSHSRANSGMPRRSSVQFNVDATDTNTSTPRAIPKSRLPTSNKDDVAFLQSMADFLTAMYGDRTTGSGAGDTTENPVGGGAAGGNRSSASRGGKGRGDISRAQCSASPHFPPSGAKGPLVKGLTANSSRHTTGDRIDTLVDTLVRAYSRQATSSRGDFQGTTGSLDDDNPISYNRPRHQNYRRAVASPRLARGSGASSGNGGADTNEVSVFVSQAMDSFIGPGGLRQQGLPSTRSVLSSLGVDKNIFGLMSFQTKSNMQDVDAVEDDDEDTKLEPIYVGQQALFKSVGTRPNMNDASVSKSMRGIIPAMLELDAEVASDDSGGAQRRVSSSNTRAARHFGNGPQMGPLNNSNLSLDSGAGLGKQDSNSSQPESDGGGAGPRAGTHRFSATNHSNNNNKSVTRCMSLDSNALGAATAGGGVKGRVEEDDSWGDDGAAPPPAPPPPPVAGGPVVVSTARSLLDYSKTLHSAAVEKALGELREEEQLKRDVVVAVERQLRGYIISLESEEREKKSKTGQQGGAAPSSSSAAAAANPTTNANTTNSKSAAGARSQPNGSAGNLVNTAASPSVNSTVNLFEKRSAPAP